MKKIVDGKMYDTAKAEKIVTWSAGYYRSDFRYCEETLYKTPRGRFFLYGEGGAYSPYANQYGDTLGAGEAIIPLSDQAANEWLEERDEADLILKHFADKVEEA
ncbi:MAG TPA: hypothetical protein VLH56_18090 [Dissulfurispiraceae bacterium]|nr:hypothetical protein [Dissulfurispiraceae bacterium]